MPFVRQWSVMSRQSINLPIQVKKKYQKSQALSFFIIINKYIRMETTRKSLRNINHCATIGNIFKQTAENCQMIGIIPQGILGKVNKTSTISCHHINELPKLEIERNVEVQLRQCVAARRFQVGWQGDIKLEPCLMEKSSGIWQKDSIEDQANKKYPQPLTATPPTKRKHKNKYQQIELWQDGVFLDRLNEFIIWNPLEDGQGFSNYDFFEK